MFPLIECLGEKKKKKNLKRVKSFLRLHDLRMVEWRWSLVWLTLVLFHYITLCESPAIFSALSELLSGLSSMML